MSQSRGTRAIKVGSNVRYIATASCRALVISGCCGVGRMGNARETDSSSAKMDVTKVMKALARFGVEVARNASTKTRIKISSADGGGNNSSSVATRSRSLTAQSSDVLCPRGQGCTVAIQSNSGFYRGLVNVERRSAAPIQRRLGLH